MKYEQATNDPFLERSLIGRTEEEKREARRRRNEEITRAAQNLLPDDQEQGE
jgi:hypothetical protein